jgi:DNA-binding transcriptional ArsR family regulator
MPGAGSTVKLCEGLNPKLPLAGRIPAPAAFILSSTGVISQPAVSQHLRILRQARLVQVVRNGQRRIYSLDPRGLAEMRAYIDSFWDQALRAFQQAANQNPVEENGDG